MHVTFTNSKALKAACLFTNPQDIRPAFQGVWLDCTGNTPALQATNGRVAAFIRIEAEVKASGRAMLPPHILAALAKSASPGCELVLETDYSDGGFSLQSPDTKWQWQDMAGNFDILRIVPRSVDLQHCHLDYALAAPFVKAAALLLGKKAVPGAVHISHDARRACYVSIPAAPEFFGVWYSRREAYNPPTSPPEWLGLPAREEDNLV